MSDIGENYIVIIRKNQKMQIFAIVSRGEVTEKSGFSDFSHEKLKYLLLNKFSV